MKTYSIALAQNSIEEIIPRICGTLATLRSYVETTRKTHLGATYPYSFQAAILQDGPDRLNLHFLGRMAPIPPSWIGKRILLQSTPRKASGDKLAGLRVAMVFNNKYQQNQTVLQVYRHAIVVLDPSIPGQASDTTYVSDINTQEDPKEDFVQPDPDAPHLPTATINFIRHAIGAPVPA